MYSTVSTASLQILIYSQKEGDNTDMDTKPETEFIVPNWGDTVNSALCRSQLYPPVRDFEFGYSYLFLKINENTSNLMS
jgi:hypothetical protein